LKEYPTDVGWNKQENTMDTTKQTVWQVKTAQGTLYTNSETRARIAFNRHDESGTDVWLLADGKVVQSATMHLPTK
jgi:hypothetical protein